jgi:hypothetical protein
VTNGTQPSRHSANGRAGFPDMVGVGLARPRASNCLDSLLFRQIWNEGHRERANRARLQHYLARSDQVGNKSFAAQDGGLPAANPADRELHVVRECYEMACVDRENFTGLQILLDYCAERGYPHLARTVSPEHDEVPFRKESLEALPLCVQIHCCVGCQERAALQNHCLPANIQRADVAHRGADKRELSRTSGGGICVDEERFPAKSGCDQALHDAALAAVCFDVNRVVHVHH